MLQRFAAAAHDWRAIGKRRIPLGLALVPLLTNEHAARAAWCEVGNDGFVILGRGNLRSCLISINRQEIGNRLLLFTCDPAIGPMADEIARDPFQHGRCLVFAE